MTLPAPARGVVRAALIVVVTLLACLSLGVLRLVYLASPAGRRRAGDRVFHVWCRAMTHILGLRLQVLGPAPRPPFLMVSNHVGYVDVIALGSRAVTGFVAKADVARWPVVGAVCRLADVVFVDRERRRDVVRVNDAIGEALDGGRGLTVFPEGTSSDGAAVLPFRSSLLEPAVRHELPVRYATLSYRTRPPAPPARLAVAWWGDMTFGPHLLQLLALDRVDATIEFGEDAIRDVDRRRLAERLHEAVARQLAVRHPSTEAA